VSGFPRARATEGWKGCRWRLAVSATTIRGTDREMPTAPPQEL